DALLAPLLVLHEDVLAAVARVGMPDAARGLARVVDRLLRILGRELRLEEVLDRLLQARDDRREVGAVGERLAARQRLLLVRFVAVRGAGRGSVRAGHSSITPVSTRFARPSGTSVRQPSRMSWS